MKFFTVVTPFAYVTVAAKVPFAYLIGSKVVVACCLCNICL